MQQRTQVLYADWESVPVPFDRTAHATTHQTDWQSWPSVQCLLSCLVPDVWSINLRLPALANCLTIALLPVPGDPEIKGTRPASSVRATSHVSFRGLTRIADVRLLLMISFYEWKPNFLDCLLKTAAITYAGESPCSKALLR